jgi:hypothetical protein
MVGFGEVIYKLPEIGIISEHKGRDHDAGLSAMAREVQTLSHDVGIQPPGILILLAFFFKA